MAVISEIQIDSLLVKKKLSYGSRGGDPKGETESEIIAAQDMTLRKANTQGNKDFVKNDHLIYHIVSV